MITSGIENMFSSKKYTFSYRKECKRDNIYLDQKIANVILYKEELFKKIKIPLEYIALKYENTTLQDDRTLSSYNIKSNDIVMVYIEVTVFETKYCDGDKGVLHKILMEYDGLIKDLKIKYCSIVNIENVKLKCKENCNDDSYVKDYLSELKGIFIAEAEINLRVIDEYNECHVMEVWESDKIKTIKCELTRRGILCRAPRQLMIDNDLLSDENDLYKYKHLDSLRIFVGFIIYPRYKGKRMDWEYWVNVGTKISRLKYLICEQTGIESDLISLLIGSKYADDESTVGEHKMKEDDEITVVTNVKILIIGDNNFCAEHIVREGQRFIEVKKGISQKHGLKLDGMKLLLGEDELNDESTVDYRRFIDDTILTVKVCDGDTNARCEVEEENVSLIIIGEGEAENVSLNIIGEGEEENVSLIIIDEAQHSQDIITVNKECSIESLRSVIARQLSIGMCFIDLYYEGRPLVHGSLHSHGIKDRDTVTLRKKCDVNEQFIVRIEYDDGSIRPFLINEFETVHNLKMSLRDQCNVNVNCITLRLGDSVWSDDAVIRGMGVENGVCVSMEVTKADVCPSRSLSLKVRDRRARGGDNEGQWTVTVNEADTVQCVMEQLEASFNESLNNYVLSVRREILRRDNVIGTYGVTDEDEVVLSRSLLVRCVVGNIAGSAKVQRYVFMPDDKVADLKKSIFVKMNIEERFINLSYNGSSLEAEQPLELYGLENESYLMMLATLAGGNDLAKPDLFRE